MTKVSVPFAARHWRRLLDELDVPVIDDKRGSKVAQLSISRRAAGNSRGVAEGGRNNELISRAGRMRYHGDSYEAILEELLRINETELQPPLDESEVIAVAQSAANYPPNDPVALSGSAGSIESKESAQALLDALNAEYAVITAGSTVAILRQLKDANGHHEVQLLTEKGFKTLTANLPKVGNTNASTYWLGHTCRRQYDGLVFDPEQRSGERHFNLFRGFATQPQPGSCRRYLRFLREVICNGDPEIVAYLIKWMAHLIQRPGEMAEVALVLRSGQGTGKNTLVAPFAEILGPMFFECTDIKRLAGNFNGHLKDKLLVHANEATWGGNKTAEGTLKAIITDPYRAVEPKGKDVIAVRNFSRLIVSSNEEWPVPAGMDDRRYVFLDVSEARKQDHQYFKAIHEEFKNGGMEALHHLLLQVDIRDWHPRERPKARHGADIKIRSLDVVGQWWYEVLESGILWTRVGSVSVECELWEKNHTVPLDHMVESVRIFAKQQNIRARVPERGSLFKRFRALCPGAKKVRPTNTTGNRQWAYQLPPQDECRRVFEKAIQCEGIIEWSEVDCD